MKPVCFGRRAFCFRKTVFQRQIYKNAGAPIYTNVGVPIYTNARAPIYTNAAAPI